MKKYYLVKVNIRDGEFEYPNLSTFVSIPSKTKSIDEKIDTFVLDYFVFKGSYQEVRLESFEEIPKKDWEVLTKYSI